MVGGLIGRCGSNISRIKNEFGAMIKGIRMMVVLISMSQVVYNSPTTSWENKHYWNTKLKNKLSQLGIDPVTHKPFSKLIADYGNIGGC
ncbi:hypothetical protein JHK85_010409 [Glycine max]|nr:hypothetical protein JHK85_010409 [Glycine max]KAG5066409.1 hypothetical protein JHK86_010140 [Glycine max]